MPCSVGLRGPCSRPSPPSQQLPQARVTSNKLRATIHRALYYLPCKQERPTGATLFSSLSVPPLLPVWVSRYGKQWVLRLPCFIGGFSPRWRRSPLFSARCTQCPRVTAVRVCTAITRVGGRVVRAPISGTAGCSARAGLVLLQSPAFRNAYIIRLLGEGGESRRSDRIPASQVPGFWKEAGTLAFKLFL